MSDKCVNETIKQMLLEIRRQAFMKELVKELETIKPATWEKRAIEQKVWRVV
jgi:hypothetical protein